ncbi:GntR family transcriptional regulator [Glycomyces albidus]|uniref:GntR family transcriptional regulator n=1 Tax=Glycomyces albidus TaxID=2656774 RepID=A0A6L5GAN9_9ACTN|nr:winged helix-turn-helix domain-containing protein [Glycomyces albidus]MQM26646.1 GntR family transcriptional regulator [Glycomyces albidus]
MDADAEIDHEAITPVYAQLVAILRARIERGDWAEGRRIMSGPQLEQAYGLSRDTVRKALRVLIDEGVLTAVPGRGTFVAPADGAEPSRPDGTGESAE